MRTNNIYNNIFSRIRLLGLFVIILIGANTVEANVDSLKQIWTNVAQPDSIRFKAINAYYEAHIYTQPDSAILVTAYHIDLADKKHSKEEKGTALNRKALAHTLKGDFDNALIEMKKAIAIYSSLNDSLELANRYNNLAIIYTHRIEYRESLKYFSKCLTYYQANNIETAEAAVLGNVGMIHLDINNYDLACLLYTSPSPRDQRGSRMPSSA